MFYEINQLEKNLYTLKSFFLLFSFILFFTSYFVPTVFKPKTH